MKNIFILCALILSNTVHAKDDAKKDIGGLYDPNYFLNMTSQKKIRDQLAEINSNDDLNIYVAITRSLSDGDVSGVNEIINDYWKIDTGDKERTALILVSLSNQEIRIQLTPNLNSKISKEDTDSIIKDIIIKNFGDQNFHTGIYDAINKINDLVNGLSETSE